LETKLRMEDKMVYKMKRRSIDEPLMEADSDSNDGPNDDELFSLLKPDSPVFANGNGRQYRQNSS